MNEVNEINVLQDFCGGLDLIGIEYMLSGSFAMNYYVKPRMTRDIDIIIKLPLNDIDKFINAFEEKYYINKIDVIDSLKVGLIHNILHKETFFKIDLIFLKNEEYRQTEFSRRKKINYEGFELYIVSKEDLIISKIIWYSISSSSLQLEDLKYLLNTDYDETYLNYWIKKLNLEKYLLKIENNRYKPGI